MFKKHNEVRNNRAEYSLHEVGQAEREESGLHPFSKYLTYSLSRNIHTYTYMHIYTRNCRDTSMNG